LPAADTDGQSDPYIRIWDTEKDVKKTQTIEDNLNPLFYETLELAYEVNKIDEMPPFILDVYD
jgi:Ca2+-dependent lipid-binding protein